MYHLQLLTPEKILFDDDVEAIIAPGTAGYLGVLTEHAPLISTLQVGVLIITDKNQLKHFYKISGGFLEVKRNRASLLVDAIESTTPVQMDGGI